MPRKKQTKRQQLLAKTKLIGLRSSSTINKFLVLVVVMAVVGVGYVVATSYAATLGGPITGVGGKCLDNQGSNAANGNKIQLYTCNKTGAQEWNYSSGGAIINANGYCLDVYHSGTASGTIVQLYTCNGTVAQQWVVNTASDTIVNPHSNLCLDDWHGQTTNGNQIWLYTCNGTDSQKWIVTPASTSGVKPPSPTPTVPTASATPKPTATPAPATPSPVALTPTASCAPAWQTISVSGVQWVRTSNNWGGANVCLNTWSGSTASYLVQSQSAKPTGGVMAYPDLSQGCGNGGGYCTANWTSKQVSALSDPQVTWVTSQSGVVSGSKYDTGADLWFSSTPNFKTNGAEIFIALNNQSEPPSTSKQVTINGVAYYFYIVPQSTWNEIIFAPVKTVSSVTNFALLPFFQYAVSQKLMPSSDYWVNASFGNEIWAGGTGLKTTSISLAE